MAIERFLEELESFLKENRVEEDFRGVPTDDSLEYTREYAEAELGCCADFPNRNQTDIDLKRVDMMLLGSLLESRTSRVKPGDLVLCLQRSYNPADDEGMRWNRHLFVGKVLVVEGQPRFLLVVDDLLEHTYSSKPCECLLDETMIIGKLSPSQYQRAERLNFQVDSESLCEVLGEEEGELSGFRYLVESGTILTN